MTPDQWLDAAYALADFCSPILAAGLAEYIRARIAQRKDRHGRDPGDGGDTGTS